MPVIKPVRGIQLNKSHSLARGLVGYWLFNEGSGKTVNDLSGNGGDGTFASGAVWSPGKFGSAVDFSTAQDYVDFGNKSKTDMRLDDWSGVVWAKITTSQNEQAFFYKGAGSPTTEGWLFEYGSVSDNLFFFISNGSSRTIVGSDTGLNGADGNYHQFGFSAVRSSDITFYLDGVAVGTAGITARESDDIVSAINLNIGSSSGSYDLLGAVDNAVLWNRALSAFDFARLYQKPFCMFEEPLNIARISSVVANGFIEIAGSLAALSFLTDTAPLRRTRGIAGGVAVQSLLTDTAALKRARGIAGGVTAQSSLAGSIKVSKKISGVISATSSLSGSLSLVGEVSRSRGSGFKPIEGAERLRGLRRSAFY